MPVPRRIAAFLLKLKRLLNRRQVDQDLDDELQFHIEHRTEEAIARGLNREDARREAILAMDNLTRRKEECRDAAGFRVLEESIRSLRFACRGLRRNPGFTATAVLTLALGIGASTAVFSLLDVVLLKPLPWRDPDRLIVISQSVTFGAKSFENAPVSAAHAREWMRSGRSLEAIALLEQNMRFGTFDDSAPERLRLTRVTPGFFELLGVAPILGRSFLATDNEPGKDAIAILGHDFWRDRMNADPTVVGKRLILDGRPLEIVGVLPASFYFPKENELNYAFHLASGVDVWCPNVLIEQDYNPSAEFNYFAIGRLRPNISSDAATAELNRVSSTLLSSANSPVKATVNLVQVATAMQAGVRDALFLLSAAVFAVLLICCVNVANLLLARALNRRKELAVRTSLGASRLRLLGDRLAESVVIAICGGFAGVLTAHWLLRAHALFAGTGIPRIEEAAIDLRVLPFSFAITAFAAIVAGALPAWRFSAIDPQEGLRQNGGNTSDPFARTIRSLLVGAQVALCVLLLVAAGLLARSFAQLVSVDKGFDAQNLVTVSVDLPPGKYGAAAHRRAAFEQLFVRLNSLPGVAAAGGVNHLPMRSESSINGMLPEGDSPRPWTEQVPANYRVASSGYFAAAGISVVAGRVFEDTDADLDAAVISLNAANRLWPGQDPIGRRLRRNGEDGWIRVVGVVSNVRQAGLDREPPMIVYRPNEGLNSFSIAVRTTLPAATATSAIRRAILDLDRNSRLGPMQTMEELVASTTVRRRLQANIVTAFALTALLLASLGIFGVISYSTAQRRAEIGLRLALGASTRDVVMLVMRQGLAPVVLGAILGIGGAIAVAHTMRSMLFGISPVDIPTFVGSLAVLSLVAVLACGIPAWRASGIAPLESLRIN
jgi:putative ABC transport system permease protein